MKPARQPMKHDELLLERLETVMGERNRLHEAVGSIRVEGAARRQKIEDLERELGQAQKAYHLGEGDEDPIHELAGELSRIRELDKGADLAHRDLQREISKSDRSLEQILRQVVAGVDVEVERRRVEMLEAWMIELAQFLRPLRAVAGPGVLAADFRTMVENEARSIHRVTDALNGARYDAPRSSISMRLPDGRLVPSNSAEARAEAERVLRAPTGYNSADALMRTAR